MDEGAASVVVGLLLLLLGGCGATTEDRPSVVPATATAPSPAPTVSPPPTPSPLAPESIKPERPAAMGTADVDGAVAAATYFLKLYPYVYATGDLEEWRLLSHGQCAFCAAVMEHVEEQTAAGGTTVGGALTIETISAREIGAQSWFAVEGTIVEEPLEQRDASGAVLQVWAQREAEQFTFALVHDQGWQVRELDVTASEGAP